MNAKALFTDEKAIGLYMCSRCTQTHATEESANFCCSWQMQIRGRIKVLSDVLMYADLRKLPPSAKELYDLSLTVVDDINKIKKNPL